jgi:hypothetical protein
MFSRKSKPPVVGDHSARMTDSRCNGVCRYLTPASAIYRLLTSPGRIGRFFDASGAPVYAAEHDRILGKGAKATARQQALARARTSSLGVAYSLSLALSFVVLSLDTHASAFTGH